MSIFKILFYCLGTMFLLGITFVESLVAIILFLIYLFYYHRNLKMKAKLEELERRKVRGKRSP